MRKQFAVAKDVDVYEVFGVSWDKDSSPALTRTDNAVGLVANVGVDGGVVTNDFDSKPLFRDIQEVTDSLGNVFVRIPKFYIRKVDEVGFKSWQICQVQRPGFYRPYCFWDFANNRELPYVDIGKHKASLGAGNKLQSISGVPPLVSTNIVNFRTYAQNNNEGGLLGYQQLDIHTIDVIRTLMLVEFANLNIQTIMAGFTGGRYSDDDVATVSENDTNRVIVANATAAHYRVGQTIGIGSARTNNSISDTPRNITAIESYDVDNTAIEFDGEPVDITEGNVVANRGWTNGFSAGIAASSGSIVSNSDGKYPCMYRGIESPFGDIWQWVDGVNINGGGTWADATPYSVGTLIVGTDGAVYRCTAGHTSSTDTKPTDGADWATVWTLHGGRQAWVAKNAEGYASNVFASPYEQLGYANLDANGYVSEMGWDASHPYAEFPTSISGGGSANFYSDYYYQASGQRVALFGGSWSLGAFAGLSSWSLHNSSTSTRVTFGCRLLRKAL